MNFWTFSNLNVAVILSLNFLILLAPNCSKRKLSCRRTPRASTCSAPARVRGGSEQWWTLQVQPWAQDLVGEHLLRWDQPTGIWRQKVQQLHWTGQLDEIGWGFPKGNGRAEWSSQDMIPVLFVSSCQLLHMLDFCSCPVPCCHVSSPNYSLYIICSIISSFSCCPSGSSCAGWTCASLLKWGLADQGCAEAERDLQIVKCTCQFWYAQEWDNSMRRFWALHWEQRVPLDCFSCAILMATHPVLHQKP